MASPETIVDPALLVALAPDLEPDEATRLLTLAARAVRAHLWPNEVPDPLPLPFEQVVLAAALRIGRATPDTSGSVVSESIGSYTYRLDRPLALDATLKLPDDLAEELEPWAPTGRHRVYTVEDPGWASPVGPWANASRLQGADTFERDLDRDDPELAGGKVATS